LHIPSIENTT